MIDWHGYSSGAGGKGPDQIARRTSPARTRLSEKTRRIRRAASAPACYSTARQMGCRGEPSGAVVVPVVRVRAEQSRLSRAVPWGRAGRRKRLESGTWGGGLEGNRAGGRKKNSRGLGRFLICSASAAASVASRVRACVNERGNWKGPSKPNQTKHADCYRACE